MTCGYCNFVNPAYASECQSCNRSLDGGGKTVTVIGPDGSLATQKKSMAPIWLFVAAIAYTVFPFDAVPDVIPVAGWAEDILFLTFTGLNALQHSAGESHKTLATILKIMKWGVGILGVIAVALILMLGAVIIELITRLFS